MSKKLVVSLKEYMPEPPETIENKENITIGILVRQACAEMYNARKQPFFSAARSVDLSTSPSGLIWYDKATVIDQIIEHIESNDRDQGVELLPAKVHARFTEWAHKNNVSRAKLKAQAKAKMIAAAKAAE